MWSRPTAMATSEVGIHSDPRKLTLGDFGLARARTHGSRRNGRTVEDSGSSSIIRNGHIDSAGRPRRHPARDSPRHSITGSFKRKKDRPAGYSQGQKARPFAITLYYGSGAPATSPFIRARTGFIRAAIRRAGYP